MPLLKVMHSLTKIVELKKMFVCDCKTIVKNYDDDIACVVTLNSLFKDVFNDFHALNHYVHKSLIIHWITY